MRLNRVAAAVLVVGSLACYDDSPDIGPGSVVTVRVSAGDSLLAVGDTVKYSAQGLDASQAFVVGLPSSWSSDNAAVAAVDAGTGVVTGVSLGNATVSATIDGVTGSAVVSVAAQQIAVADSNPTFTGVATDTGSDIKSIAVTNGGPGTLTALSVGTIQYGAGGSGWLVAAFDSATAPTAVTLTAAPGALLPGTYSATVPILAATAGNSPLDLNVSFVVIAPPSGAPGRLVVMTEPAGATSNVTFTTQPVVEVQDSAGTRVFNAVIPVTASILTGNGTLVGTATVTPVNGHAIFAGLTIRGVQSAGDTLGFGAHEIEFTAAGTDPDTSGSFDVAVSFSYNVAYLFELPMASCLACHSTFGDPAVLVNQPPTLNAPGCGTLVVPSSSATSYLMQKMDNTHPGGCGTVMPTGGSLAQTLRDMVRTWINEGAANN